MQVRRMNPRESALLSAAATLLGHNRDTAYGPAHAVRDALELEQEVEMQTYPERAAAASANGKRLIAELQSATDKLREAGAL